MGHSSFSATTSLKCENQPVKKRRNRFLLGSGNTARSLSCWEGGHWTEDGRELPGPMVTVSSSCGPSCHGNLCLGSVRKPPLIVPGLLAGWSNEIATSFHLILSFNMDEDQGKSEGLSTQYSGQGEVFSVMLSVSSPSAAHRFIQFPGPPFGRTHVAPCT